MFLKKGPGLVSPWYLAWEFKGNAPLDGVDFALLYPRDSTEKIKAVRAFHPPREDWEVLRSKYCTVGTCWITLLGLVANVRYDRCIHQITMIFIHQP